MGVEQEFTSYMEQAPALEPETEDKELYQQELSDRGWSSGYTKEEAGYPERVSGTIYRVGDQEYIMPDAAVSEIYRNRPYNEANGEFVTDENVINEIQKQAELDKSIEAARNEKAKEMSGGDEILEDILRTNIDYNRGRIDNPMQVKGVDFYCVGHNSSHVFFMGTNGGRKYTLTYEPGEESAENGHFKEVESFAGGYYGHY